MTLPRLAALTRQWQRIPRLAVAVAAIASALGVKFDAPPPQQGDGMEQDFGEMAAMLGGVQGFTIEG